MAFLCYAVPCRKQRKTPSSSEDVFIEEDYFDGLDSQSQAGTVIDIKEGATLSQVARGKKPRLIGDFSLHVAA